MQVSLRNLPIQPKLEQKKEVSKFNLNFKTYQVFIIQCQNIVKLANPIKKSQIRNETIYKMKNS